MTTGSHKHANPGGGPGKSADPAKSDAFVDRLGDRLSSEHSLPAQPAFPSQAALPSQVVVPGPPTPSGRVLAKFPAAHEASDVHPLPPSGEDDDALDFPPVGPQVDPGDAFAEFEDELEADNTRIDDSHLLAEQSTSIIDSLPAQPFLAVEKGNDMGREFVLQQGENGIGRGIDNDVILADVAVSRRHLRVILEGDRLTLKDLGSGNGSQVNGEKVSQVQLVDGDRIDVGETTLVVRIPGAALPAMDPYDGEGVTDENNINGTLPPPSFPAGTPSNPLVPPYGPGYQPELTPSATSAPPGMRTASALPRTGAVVLPKPVFLAIIAAGALLLAMMGAAIALLAIRSGSDDDATTVTLASEGGPFDRGVAAYQAHRWDEAEGAFREAASADEPDPRVGPYLERVGLARQHEQAIGNARQSLEAGHANEALSSATSVPEDSPLASQAREVAGQAREHLVRAHVEAGRRAIGQNDLQEARNQLENARNTDPTSGLVRAFEVEVQRVGPTAGTGQTGATAPVRPVSPPATPAAGDDDSDDERTASRSGSSGRRSTASRRRGHSAPAASTGSGERTAITAYLAGRFDQAASAARTAASGASAADRRRLETMAGNITQFGQLWGRVGRVTSPSPGQRRDMERAMALDERIARSPQYRNQLRERVVSGYLAEARAHRSDPTASCTAVRSALRLQGSNPQARQMATECEARARTVLAGARNAPAARRVALYRQVLAMVPASSPTAQEAQRLMSSARRQTSYDEDE